MAIVLTALLLGGVWSCKNEVTQRKNVLIILSYDSQHSQYADFIKEIQQTIEVGGYITDCKVVYMNLEYAPDAAFDVLHHVNDSLSKIGWIPNVIITDDDRSARILLADRSDEFLNLKETPIVLGSVSFLRKSTSKVRPIFVCGQIRLISMRISNWQVGCRTVIRFK